MEKVEKTDIEVEELNTPEEEKEQIMYDLNNEKDLETIKEKVDTQGNWFKPVVNRVYKFTLNSPKIVTVVKEFKENDGSIKKVTKYAIDITAEDKDKNIFVGVWEAGNKVIKTIAHDYKDGQVFKLTRTGEGMNTEYNIIADF